MALELELISPIEFAKDMSSRSRNTLCSRRNRLPTCSASRCYIGDMLQQADLIGVARCPSSSSPDSPSARCWR